MASYADDGTATYATSTPTCTSTGWPFTTVGSSNGTTSATITDTWRHWVVTTFGSDQTTTTWYVWNNHVEQRKQTRAEMAEKERNERRRKRAAFWKATFDTIIRKKAEKRARELLHMNLSEAQRKTLAERNWFVVQGGKSGKQYRIEDKGSVHGNVVELGRKTEFRYCFQAADPSIPVGDNLLAQALMVMYDEDSFLKIANKSGPYQRVLEAA